MNSEDDRDNLDAWLELAEACAEQDFMLGGSVQNTRLGGNAEESKGAITMPAKHQPFHPPEQET